MNNTCTAILLLVFIIEVTSSALDSYLDYIRHYRKNYESLDDFLTHFAYFRKALEFSKDELADVSQLSYYADLSDEEFYSIFRRDQSSNFTSLLKQSAQELDKNSQPIVFDWRNFGVVSKVKKQEPYTDHDRFFAESGVIEGCYAIKNKNLVELTTQQFVDCFKKNLWSYIEVHGLESDQEYPYQGTKSECKYSQDKVVAKNINGTHFEDFTEENIKEYLVKFGPLKINVHSNVIRYYVKGRITYLPDLECSEWVYHFYSTVIVGYGIIPQPFWLLKTSLGSDFGEEGYIKIPRGTNMCHFLENNVLTIPSIN